MVGNPIFRDRATGGTMFYYDQALLRWNTCARIIMRNKLAPRPQDEYAPSLE